MINSESCQRTYTRRKLHSWRDYNLGELSHNTSNPGLDPNLLEPQGWQTDSIYAVLLDGEAQTVTIQGSSTNGFHDIVLSTHGSYSSGGLTIYQYQQSVYKDMGCYYYEWTAPKGEKVRELKEPRINPCR